MRFIILVMVFLVMSCHANDRRLASDTEENINVCSRSNVMEELQCLNAKNIELQEKLRELGNNEKTHPIIRLALTTLNQKKLLHFRNDYYT